MSLDRLLRELEGKEPRREPRTLRELGIAFRDPVSVEETMEALDALGMWEDLNLMMCGCSYNADPIERGRERFVEILFAAVGIRDASPMRQIQSPEEA